MKESNLFYKVFTGIMLIINLSLIFFIIESNINVSSIISFVFMEIFIVYFYFKAYSGKLNSKYGQIKDSWKNENALMIGGTIIVFVAVSTPFLVMYFNNYSYNIETFEKLGTVGDYFGGSTVGLLNLASLLFVTAAMFMQKEELKLQRKELKLQRDEVAKTRQEYEITNKTMKKQAFDSTFFNMINLHHSILAEIKIENYIGRYAIENLYQELKSRAKEEFIIEWNKYFSNHICNDWGKIEYFFEDLIHQYDLEREKGDIYDVLMRGETDRLNPEKLYGYDYLKEEPESLEYYLKNKNPYIKWEYSSIYSDLFKETKKTPNKDMKKNIYERFYKDRVNLIGHYYRNLYRIVKLIQEYEFSINEEVNNIEKKNYRGILRAQLSSFELLMLFYNITYAKKGEKFEKILLETDFFEEHVVVADFIWRGDIKEIEKFKLNNK